MNTKCVRLSPADTPSCSELENCMKHKFLSVLPCITCKNQSTPFSSLIAGVAFTIPHGPLGRRRPCCDTGDGTPPWVPLDPCRTPGQPIPAIRTARVAGRGVRAPLCDPASHARATGAQAGRHWRKRHRLLLLLFCAISLSLLTPLFSQPPFLSTFKVSRHDFFTPPYLLSLFFTLLVFALVLCDSKHTRDHT